MRIANDLRSDSAMASEIWKLEAQLWHLSRAERLKIILAASAERAEGKTTTVAYLATALALHPGRKILAVDLDFRCPKLSTHLEIQTEHGIADVIRGECTLEQVVTQTAVPGLDIIAPSAGSADPGLLMNSSKLRDIFDILRPGYDLILVDTPALIPVADAAEAIPLSDGVLLIAMAGRTNRHHLGRARDLCLRLGAKILGLVVGNIQEAAPEYLTASTYGSPKGRTYGSAR